MILVDEALKAHGRRLKTDSSGSDRCRVHGPRADQPGHQQRAGDGDLRHLQPDPDRAARVYQYAGRPDVVEAGGPGALEDAILSGRPVVTEDAFS